MKFKVGDRVFSWRFGWLKIHFIDHSHKYGLVTIRECDQYKIPFILDGRQSCGDFMPTLLTVEEAAKYGIVPEKKKVKKTIKRWANIYCDVEYIFMNERTAERHADGTNALAVAVPFEIVYETEE